MTERVQVAVRLRPFIPSDPLDAELNALVLDDTHVSVGSNRVFTADRVFMMESDTESLYEACVQPLVHRFVSGCNASVMAYGQTGTGKTFTVQELLPLILTQILEDEAVQANHLGSSSPTEAGASTAPQPLLRLRYVEVYGEAIRDLLDDAPAAPQSPEKQRKLRLITTTHHNTVAISEREEERDTEDALLSEAQRLPSQQHGRASPHSLTRWLSALAGQETVSAITGCSLIGAKTVPVFHIAEAAQWIARGDARRATGATNVHARSSRSHAILSFLHPCYACRLDIVDLAGSEREKKTGNAGVRLQESIAINTGLLALGNVIRALSRQHRSAKGKEKNTGSTLIPTSMTTMGVASNAHIPYRSSKLTRLLQDTLGGSSATLFIACVAPDTLNADETLRTLEYCALALRVLNTPLQQMERRRRVHEYGQRRASPSRNGFSNSKQEDDTESRGEQPLDTQDEQLSPCARLRELEAAYAFLQQQYDEQAEVLASICVSDAAAKDRVVVCEEELRKDEAIFTSQIRTMQTLISENQQLRRRLGKVKGEKVRPSTRSREKGGVISRPGRHSRPDLIGQTSMGEMQQREGDAKRSSRGSSSVQTIFRSTTNTVPPPPAPSAQSPYRQLNFQFNSALRESENAESNLNTHPNRNHHDAAAVGVPASSEVLSEPVQSFIRNILQKHGIHSGGGEEFTEATVLAVSSSSSDEASRQSSLLQVDGRVTQRVGQQQRGVNEGNHRLQSHVAVSHHVPLSALPTPVGHGERDTSTSAGLEPSPKLATAALQEQDPQLLALADHVLRYEEANASLRNQVRLLQAKLDDKAREAARLRLEVQDIKEIYSSLSAMTEV